MKYATQIKWSSGYAVLKITRSRISGNLVLSWSSPFSHPSKPHPIQQKTYLRAHLLGHNKGPCDAWLDVGQWLRNICNQRVKKRRFAMMTFDYGRGRGWKMPKYWLRYIWTTPNKENGQNSDEYVLGIICFHAMIWITKIIMTIVMTFLL